MSTLPNSLDFYRLQKMEQGAPENGAVDAFRAKPPSDCSRKWSSRGIFRCLLAPENGDLTKLPMGRGLLGVLWLIKHWENGHD